MPLPQSLRSTASSLSRCSTTTSKTCSWSSSCPTSLELSWPLLSGFSRLFKIVELQKASKKIFFSFFSRRVPVWQTGRPSVPRRLLGPPGRRTTMADRRSPSAATGAAAAAAGRGRGAPVPAAGKPPSPVGLPVQPQPATSSQPAVRPGVMSFSAAASKAVKAPAAAAPATVVMHLFLFFLFFLADLDVLFFFFHPPNIF